ncbi:ATP-binding protein [Embleya sp. NPDC020886]|uniref:ATP-binding protein n=1 Tax=Embleya sp. NPDC020886 TaxID=3363980 RepID=UPI0037A42571
MPSSTLKQDFPISATSVKHVRDCVRSFCVDLGFPSPIVDSAPLIASELATNAVRHAKGHAVRAEFTLVLTLSGGRLDIAVWDYHPSPCPPLSNLADIPPDAQHGRGLALVCLDAAGFTWTRTPTGKLVSAWIQVGEAPARRRPQPTQAGLF